MSKLILILLLLALAGWFLLPTHLPFITVPQDLVGQLREALPEHLSLPEPLVAPKRESSGELLTASGITRDTQAQRSALHLQPFARIPALDAIARTRVQDMFAKNYFAHVTPEGTSVSDVAKQQQYMFLAIGENIALGFFENDTALVQAWMDSPGHRANIVNPRYIEIGIAVQKGRFNGEDVWIAAQIFGRPKSLCPSPPTAVKEEILRGKQELSQLETQADVLRAQTKLMQPSSEEEYEEYKKHVATYNALVRTINEKIDAIKKKVQYYNQAIDALNACIST